MQTTHRLGSRDPNADEMRHTTVIDGIAQVLEVVTRSVQRPEPC